MSNIEGGLASAGVVDINNSTNVPLGSNATFTGQWFDALQYSEMTLMVAADQAVAPDGLKMQVSNDGKVVAITKAVTTSNGPHTLVVTARYFRVIYTNGPIAQGSFSLQVLFHMFKSKELTSTLDQTLTTSSDVTNVRAVIAAQDTSGAFRNVVSDQLGALKVNVSTLNQSAFGEIKSVQPEARLQETFTFNINPRIWDTTEVGTGTVSQVNSMASVSTGATAGGLALMESKRTVRYRSGQGILSRFTALFTPGVLGSIQIIGIGDIENGFFFGYVGTVFGILHRNSASGSPIDTFISQSTWNVDKADGTQTLPVQDWAKGNVFEVQFQFLGFGTLRFFVEDSASGDFVLVHTIPYANENVLPSLGDPVLPVSIFVDNGLNNTELKIMSGSMSVFVEGAVHINGLNNSVDHLKNIGTTETNILTLQNRLTYVGKTNNHLIFPSFVSIATIAGNKPVLIRLVVNATLGGTPVFVDVDTNTSIAAFDVAGTTVTGGNAAMTVALGKEDSMIFDIEKITPFIKPGDTLTISAVTSASTVDVLVAISFVDDI